MSLKMVLLLAGIASLSGMVVGYFLRWIVSLGKKGSMELTIKQKMLEAKTQAQKIVEEAEKKSETLLFNAKEEVKQR